KKEMEAFQAKPYHYENQFDVASGEYTLKVVFSSGGESFGKLESPLKIEPYDGKHFAVSALALSKDFQKASEDASLDAALLEGRAPLVALNLRFIPTGLVQFKPTQQAGIYMEIYEPLLVEPGNNMELAIQLRVVDRQSGQQRLNSGYVPVTNFIRKE